VLEDRSVKLPCPDHTRESKSNSIVVNVAKTLTQIVVFWSFFLAVLPMVIAAVEHWLGIPSFASPGTRIAGAAIFVAMGSIGFYCGMIFAVLGSGTPLPLDTTTKLVIVGPYRHIRNPMALTGITQGFAVGLYLGSPLTVVYAILGAFAWHFLARPWEEADLERRFGAPYSDYKNAVQCWIPKLAPYVAPRLPLDEGVASSNG
jgi:protein-S-isoprenylcysteine O-methyltransferase Ste14